MSLFSETTESPSRGVFVSIEYTVPSPFLLREAQDFFSFNPGQAGAETPILGLQSTHPWVLFSTVKSDSTMAQKT